MFVSVEFCPILLGMQINFINKKFDKPIKISYNKKYIKRDVVFWKLMDNVSFQILLLLCIWSMFFPNQIQFHHVPLPFLYFFPDFLICLFLFLCPFLFRCLFLCYFLLLPSQMCYYTFFQSFFNSWIFNNIINSFRHK